MKAGSSRPSPPSPAGRAACGRILDAMEPCTALYCSSDAIGLGALRTLYDRGLKVPEQMSVLSIGNGEPAYVAYSVPAPIEHLPPDGGDGGAVFAAGPKTNCRPWGGNEQIYLDTPVYLRESLGPAPVR